MNLTATPPAGWDDRIAHDRTFLPALVEQLRRNVPCEMVAQEERA